MQFNNSYMFTFSTIANHTVHKINIIIIVVVVVSSSSSSFEEKLVYINVAVSYECWGIFLVLFALLYFVFLCAIEKQYVHQFSVAHVFINLLI